MIFLPEKSIKICPKCGFTKFKVVGSYKVSSCCMSCGYVRDSFPEINISEVKNYREHLSKISTDTDNYISFKRKKPTLLAIIFFILSLIALGGIIFIIIISF